MIEDDVVGRVARLAKLLQHDLAFALQLALLESRVGQNVGQDVQRQRHIVLQDAGMKGGLLAAGIGVEEAADRFDLLGDGAGRATLPCP